MHAIITTQYRDLYYGEIVDGSDADIASTKAVRVRACRHIPYWHGPTGGLTSLAVEGPDNQSRIGAPCDALLTGVAHVLTVTDEARARFDAVEP